MAKTNQSVTDKDIVKALSKKLKLDKELTRKVVSLYFDEIKKAVLENQKVRLAGFGTFETKKWNASQIYDINAKEKVSLDLKTVRFKPSSLFKKKIFE
jgi:nucleoid DNA-binding protein